MQRSFTAVGTGGQDFRQAMVRPSALRSAPTRAVVAVVVVVVVVWRTINVGRGPGVRLFRCRCQRARGLLRCLKARRAPSLCPLLLTGNVQTTRLPRAQVAAVESVVGYVHTGGWGRVVVAAQANDNWTSPRVRNHWTKRLGALCVCVCVCVCFGC